MLVLAAGGRQQDFELGQPFVGVSEPALEVLADECQLPVGFFEDGKGRFSFFDVEDQFLSEDAEFAIGFGDVFGEVDDSRDELHCITIVKYNDRPMPLIFMNIIPGSTDQSHSVDMNDFSIAFLLNSSQYIMKEGLDSCNLAAEVKLLHLTFLRHRSKV